MTLLAGTRLGPYEVTIAQVPPAWEVVSDIRDASGPYFSPDGRFLAVAGFSEEVGVWSEKGGPPLRLPGHEPSPRSGNTAA